MRQKENSVQFLIVHCRSGFEHLVASYVSGVVVMRPFRVAPRHKKGAVQYHDRPVLPGLVFVPEGRLPGVNGVPYVRGIMAIGGNPCMVTAAELENFVDGVMAETEKMKTRRPKFYVGQKVTISDGPFVGLSGVYSGAGRVELTSNLGGVLKVRIPDHMIKDQDLPA